MSRFDVALAAALAVAAGVCCYTTWTVWGLM